QPKTLIIEDTKLAAIALKGLLSKKNFESTLVETGNDALDILKKENFDIIFLDLGLPDIDGMELLPKIRNHQPSKNTVVIVLSGHINPELQKKCMTHGADAVFTKPFTIDHLNNLFSV
ncbi:MAG: response regulator, partial [Gammaproteobacteria bacterium]|nr:response regulator [Gammaproteobacteria bacterium]